MSTVRADNLQAVNTDYTIPLSELRQRVIKDYRTTYNSGSWEPTTTYGWAPGLFYDYTPASASSRIRVSIGLGYGHSSGHSICHCIFYANGVEINRHCISGQSPEHRHTYIFDFASWGTTSGRIGYQMRAYGTSNQPRVHGTYYWNGAGSNQNVMSHFIIEEYFAIP